VTFRPCLTTGLALSFQLLEGHIKQFNAFSQEFFVLLSGLSHLNFIDIVKFVVFNILAPSRKAAKFFKLASGLRLNPA